ncbi:hypothetical protein BOQ60_23605 [Chryseobacterium sp. CH1]|nr:hypothetical protein BOQ60_23605 [Chryseobacterium sp. CH1]
MIIGNGILANALKFYDKDDVIFFASGVSNSLEKEASEFEREISLLKSVVSQNPDKKFFYFSTCSIYDPTKTGSPYVIHKLKIEKTDRRTLPTFRYLKGRKCSRTWWQSKHLD